MIFPLTIRRVRVSSLLLTVLVWACSSNDPAGPVKDDSKQHIDGSKAGSAGQVDGKSDGGSSGDEPEPGSGNTGSVGEHDPDGDPNAGKGNHADDPAPEPGEGGAHGDGDDPSAPTEGFLRGQAFVTQNECTMCHTENFAGFTVFPNITPDRETGIGSWTDAQIVAAIRDGLEPGGATLCDTMARYPLSDEQAADVVEFLRGIPAVSNRLTSDCP